jgi:opacity protein-like surface antigen
MWCARFCGAMWLALAAAGVLAGASPAFAQGGASGAGRVEQPTLPRGEVFPRGARAQTPATPQRPTMIDPGLVDLFQQQTTTFPLPSFTGFYAGAHLGYGFGDNPARIGTTPETFAFQELGLVPLKLRPDGEGIVGGATWGFNLVIPGLLAVEESLRPEFVVGLNLTYQSVRHSAHDSFQGTHTVTAGGITLAETDVTRVLQRINNIYSAQARAGVLISPNVMVYAGGGPAFTEIRNSLFIDTTVTATGIIGGVPRVLGESTFQHFGQRTETKVGSALSLGAEWKLTPAMSFKVEGTDYHFGKTSVIAPSPTGGPDDFFTLRQRNQVNTITAGINIALDAFFLPRIMQQLPPPPPQAPRATPRQRDQVM